MRLNKKVQDIYRIHSQHLLRDARHLGDAENVKDILNVVDEIKPNVYMLSLCCTDREPTLQLATFEKIRRMRLNLLSLKERKDVIKLLENIGIEYKITSYLPLNRDFSETLICKIQRKLPKWILSIYFKWKVFKENIKNIKSKIRYN